MCSQPLVTSCLLRSSLGAAGYGGRKVCVCVCKECVWGQAGRQPRQDGSNLHLEKKDFSLAHLQGPETRPSTMSHSAPLTDTSGPVSLA
eukprot:2349913-Prymnesium_polylepis.1